MDQLFEFLYRILPVLHVLAGIAFITKMVLIFRKRGINMGAVFISFFRIYTKSDKRMTNSKTRHRYMMLNNSINYYMYIWALITVIIFIVFRSSY